MKGLLIFVAGLLCGGAAVAWLFLGRDEAPPPAVESTLPAPGLGPDGATGLEPGAADPALPPVARDPHEAPDIAIDPLDRVDVPPPEIAPLPDAPAALAYACGMQGGWDWLVLSYFVGCGVSRLARYNVTAEAMSADEGKVTYFEGTPIPTSLALVIVLAVAAWLGRIGDDLWFGELDLGWQLHPLVLLFALSGSLMISKTLRIPKP